MHECLCEDENITTVDACEIIFIIIQLGIERFIGKMIKAHSAFSSGNKDQGVPQ
jgi:hypothetical protein